VRTVGGSSGGSGASVSANFGTVSVAQEGYASIRRPSAWNSVVGMRPTAGLVSGTGSVGGKGEVGSLGPIARTVADLAAVLDILVGYDPEDPKSALGVGNTPKSYTEYLDKNGLKGARLGIIREPIGLGSDPTADDFKETTGIFNNAVNELKAAGAEIVDPITIPNLMKLLATRAGKPDDGEGWKDYYGNNPTAPFKSDEEMRKSPDYQKVFPWARIRATIAAPGQDFQSNDDRYYKYLLAREELKIAVMDIMAKNHLDALVYKTVEHLPTLIADGLKPPYPNMKGAPHMNTFLVYVPVISVPAGFSKANLPVGITFQGRPYAEATLIKLAYAFEQATHHRRPPPTVPPLD
jgi:amidase